MTTRRIRRASRILLLNGAGELLLFRFTPDDRAPFWCAPGGEAEEGETYDEAATRELWEETGIRADCGPEVARVISDFVTLAGEPVTGDDRYYLLRMDNPVIDTAGHTETEQAVMREYRWFAHGEIAGWPETIYPYDLTEMLERVLAKA